MGDPSNRARLGQVLGQRRGDAVEAALHARLADALLEARGVADRERREAGERFEQARLDLAEAPIRIARRDPEHTAALTGPRHLCGDRAAEALVRAVRDGLG